ncbi:hypothetical protein [Glycomyces artemisiae]|uniref:Uncharacterized protein n=1 Tax=Glycomyces artemisiae TaxID=1076443 RepID=A0A2T0U6G9_9ACTN|nr:hypothetical protein [Glycomyces artemisiae]PRY53516.1 hypothetical protein B0I28_11715 [Glycomyces artemisiae]
MTTDDSPAMRALMDAYDRYDEARSEVIDAAIDANLDGTGANEIARRLTGIPGLGRNRLLELLAAGRRAAAVRDLIAADRGYRNLHVRRIDAEVHLSSVIASPLDEDRARRFWTGLARQGLTVVHYPVDALTPVDPDAALAALTHLDDVEILVVVDLRTQR